MKCIYLTSGGGWDGLKHALESAVRFSGVPVYCISEVDYGIGTHIPVKNYMSYVDKLSNEYGHMWDKDGLHQLGLFSLNRWLVLLDYMEKNTSDEPIYAPDWDVLVFQDLNVALEPFMELPAASLRVGIVGFDNYWQNVHMVKNTEPLKIFLRTVYDLLKKGCNNLHDMGCWTEAVNKGCLQMTDMNKVVNGSYFDPAITYDPGRYHGKDVFQHEQPKNEMEATGHIPSMKVVKWVSGKPYFVLKDTGELVKANTIHCWGPLKGSTAKVLADAVNGRNDP
jgi:hypothetical protein